MKRIIGLFICLELLLSVIPACAFSANEKEAIYSNALAEFETYLEKSISDVTSLEEMKEKFAQSQNVYSRAFVYYLDVLLMIEEEDFSWEMKLDLDDLKSNSSFISYIDEMGATSIVLPDILEKYAYGRQYEFEGDTIKAVSFYADCSDFFDSADIWLRLSADSAENIYNAGLELMDKGKYAEAYEYFVMCPGYEDSDEIAAYILNTKELFPAHEHDWINVSCTQNMYCSVCGQQGDKGTIHDYKFRYIVTESDCINYGEALYYCSGCNETKIEDIQPNGEHEWVNATVNEPKTCRICGMTVGEPITGISIGEIVKFGSFEQDGYYDNGTEQIEWRVLDVKDNTALLISERALYAGVYHYKETSVNWYQSSLRTWLNEEFYYEAFSDDDRKKITLCDDVIGSVFLLSVDEAEKYFVSDADRKCAPTVEAVKRGANKSNNYSKDGEPTWWWWLRTPGYQPNQAARIYVDGRIFDDKNSAKVAETDGAVRPCIWVDITQF